MILLEKSWGGEEKYLERARERSGVNAWTEKGKNMFTLLRKFATGGLFHELSLGLPWQSLGEEEPGVKKGERVGGARQ